MTVAVQQQQHRRPPALVYDPDAPQYEQSDPATCAACSLAWALRSLGRDVGEWDAVALLGPWRWSESQGLLRPDGSGLVATLREQGLAAGGLYPAAFGDAVTHAGRGPVLLGGVHWGAEGHWVGVRGYDPTTDTLALANSAVGYDGVYDTLSRAQWARVGPCALVWVEL